MAESIVVTSSAAEVPKSLAGDMLHGVEEIAEFLGMTPRQTNHALAMGRIPGTFKLGSSWKGRRSAIVEGLRRLEQGAA